MTAQTLSEHCITLAQAAEDAAAWAQNNADVVRSELSGLQLELRRSKRAFRQCARAAARKMCAGVFGPSQAGKSYLISALARDKTGELLALFGDKRHDFISEVNPEGGKESTGLVTRFTMSRPSGLPQDFPVQIRLLTETDLVKIIANAYYADCEHKEVPDPKAINEALNALRSRPGQGASHIDLDALEDLREYLVKDFQAKPRVQELERSFWPSALEIGLRLDLEDRIKLYSLIWDQIPQFTELLRQLTLALEQLAYASEAFCPLDALIPRSGSIIDVAMLEGLGNPGGPFLQVRASSGSVAELPRSIVTALTAELTIVMAEKPDDYFDYTDLLDFPGYRSRFKFSEVRKELEKSGMIKELFLRGKVAYLFQRYCAEKELTSMLLCIGPSNQEVQDLPGVINDWIVSTHGEAPETRKGKPPALFLILTKFDMEFEDKAGAPSVESRWDNRLHASLLDFFGKQYAWPMNWDGVNGFNNLFLLRNPNFKFKTALDYDENSKETGIRKDAQKLVDALQSAFLNSRLVARHFKDPGLSWEAAMRLNDGGISHIRDTLRPLCNPDIKNTQIATVIEERCSKLALRLGAFYKTDDKDEERQQKEQFGRQLLASFSRLLQNQLVGEFLSRIMVRDQDLYDLYFEARRRFLMADEDKSGEEFPRSIGGSVNADDAFAELFGEESPAPASIEGEDKAAQPVRSASESAYFTDLIISSWCDKLRAFADDPRTWQRYGLSSPELSKLVSELTVGLARLNIGTEMEKAMEEAAAYANTSKERIIWQQVGRAGVMLNGYLNWLGFNPRARSSDERTIIMQGKAFTLFEPPAPVEDFPKLPEIQPPFEKNWCMDWMRALYTLLLNNVDFDGILHFDRKKNALLGSLIKQFDLSVAGNRQ
ncbi:MAG: putative virulence factor [Desulfovibrio sp.]|nr:putative virulence factor [Desulfovibrio sp.]